MGTYTMAGHDTHEFVDGVISEHCPDLHEAEVTTRVTFAHGREIADGENSPAILRHGRPVLGRAKCSSLEDRVAGEPDILITLDEAGWTGLDEAGRSALVHHLLAGFATQPANASAPEPGEDEGDGRGDPEAEPAKALIKYDSSGRPKLRRVHPDVQVEWYNSVAKAHGQKAPEYAEAASLVEHMRQLDLPLVGVMRRGKREAA